MSQYSISGPRIADAIANQKRTIDLRKATLQLFSPKQEKELGKGAGEAVIEQYRNQILPERDKRVQLVQHVLARLMPESGISNKENLAVCVIDSPDVNAFVTPDNNVFVFTGILPICKNEDGVAAVLGHEIAYNFAHHLAETAHGAARLLSGKR